MTDVTQHIEQALYDCLAGKILYDGAYVPVKAGMNLNEAYNAHCVVFGNVVDNSADSLSHYFTEATVTLQVVSLPDGYSHKPVNAIAAFCRALITPSFGVHGLTAPAGMKFLNVRVSSPQGYIEEWQDGRAIIRKILNVSIQINHS
jgi:hypothetical protein